MTHPVFKLEACEYGQLNKHTQVFNVNVIEHFVYIYMSPEIAKGFSLFEVSKVSPDQFEIHDIQTYFFRENYCWLRVKSEALSKEAGQHTYKLSLINEAKDIVSLFISYIIQDDNPDKPYIYMNRDGKCSASNCCCCAVSGCSYRKS